MLKNCRRRQLGNDAGFATIEAALLLFSFFVITSFSVGVFGVVHSGIMNSISARTYAFETFRQRANVTYFRDEVRSIGERICHYNKSQFRLHGITVDRQNLSSGDLNWYATPRSISALNIGEALDPGGEREGRITRQKAHSVTVDREIERSLSQARSTDRAAIVMIKVVYGICTLASCGGDGP